jgi:hypothetical protein
VADLACPQCGNPIHEDTRFCPRCGRSLLPGTVGPSVPSAPVYGSLPPPHRDQTVRNAIIVVAVLVVLLGAGLGYFYAVYTPDHDVVTMDCGSWLVNGASSSLAVTIGCSDCGQAPKPSAQFTIHLNVQVASSSCSYFCPSYQVNSFSVDSPYVLLQVAPQNLPYSEGNGDFNTWSLTILAPSGAGHDPLGGIVGVTYE